MKKEAPPVTALVTPQPPDAAQPPANPPGGSPPGGNPPGQPPAPTTPVAPRVVAAAGVALGTPLSTPGSVGGTPVPQFRVTDPAGISTPGAQAPSSAPSAARNLTGEFAALAQEPSGEQRIADAFAASAAAASDAQLIADAFAAGAQSAEVDEDPVEGLAQALMEEAASNPDVYDDLSLIQTAVNLAIEQRGFPGVSEEEKGRWEKVITLLQNDILPQLQATIPLEDRLRGLVFRQACDKLKIPVPTEQPPLEIDMQIHEEALTIARERHENEQDSEVKAGWATLVGLLESRLEGIREQIARAARMAMEEEILKRVEALGSQDRAEILQKAIEIATDKGSIIGAELVAYWQSQLAALPQTAAPAPSAEAEAEAVEFAVHVDGADPAAVETHFQKQPPTTPPASSGSGPSSPVRGKVAEGVGSPAALSEQQLMKERLAALEGWRRTTKEMPNLKRQWPEFRKGDAVAFTSEDSYSDEDHLIVLAAADLLHAKVGDRIQETWEVQKGIWGEAKRKLNQESKPTDLESVATKAIEIATGDASNATVSGNLVRYYWRSIQTLLEMEKEFSALAEISNPLRRKPPNGSVLLSDLPAAAKPASHSPETHENGKAAEEIPEGPPAHVPAWFSETQGKPVKDARRVAAANAGGDDPDAPRGRRRGGRGGGRRPVQDVFSSKS